MQTSRCRAASAADICRAHLKRAENVEVAAVSRFGNGLGLTRFLYPTPWLMVVSAGGIATIVKVATKLSEIVGQLPWLHIQDSKLPNAWCVYYATPTGKRKQL